MASPRFVDALAAAKKIADEVLRPTAAAVDRENRFPRESIDALKAAQLLSASVPEDLGGMGLSITELSDICGVLGQACSASAMVFAMHHIQVATIVRHGLGSNYFKNYLRECVDKQLLIASVTSEVGPSGDMRSSVAGAVVQGDRYSVTKHATTISYGAYADDHLITCKRSPTAAAADQIAIMCRKANTTLEQTGTWDTLGMRGTQSPGFILSSTGSIEQFLPEGAEMASRTVVPYSHMLWAGLWLGIATDAVGKCRQYLRTEARKKPGTTPPVGVRVSELTTQLQLMRSLVRDTGRDIETVYSAPGGDEVLAAAGWALRLNQVKIAASQMSFDICVKALQTLGIAAYRQDSPVSLGRHVRDALSASLMVGNDRIHHSNASFLCVFKDD